jgi:hypothetical protein
LEIRGSHPNIAMFLPFFIKETLKPGCIAVYDVEDIPCGIVNGKPKTLRVKDHRTVVPLGSIPDPERAARDLIMYASKFRKTKYPDQIHPLQHVEECDGSYIMLFNTDLFARYIVVGNQQGLVILDTDMVWIAPAEEAVPYLVHTS